MRSLENARRNNTNTERVCSTWQLAVLTAQKHGGLATHKLTTFVTHRKWRSGRGVSCRVFHCAVCTECRSSLLPAEALSADPLLDQKVKSMFLCSYFRYGGVTLWVLGWTGGSVWGGAVRGIILDNSSHNSPPPPILNHRDSFLVFSVTLHIVLTRTFRCPKLQGNGKAVPGQALRVPEVWRSQISRQSAHKGGKVVSLMHRPPLPPRIYRIYSRNSRHRVIHAFNTIFKKLPV